MGRAYVSNYIVCLGAYLTLEVKLKQQINKNNANQGSHIL